MTPLIAILPDHVANQIAAGEVVQRPASIVKELLENSIDAAATKITIHLSGAGKTGIIVTDNGSGMNEKDAELCFRRHATSKIKTAEDLFALTTRGFRGEAMASIAAVSHVILRTNNEETSLGTQLNLEDGKVISKAAFPGPKGSIVEVKNLFYNVPARRKFLKNDRIELKHCIDEFHRVALLHAHIEWVLKSDDKLLFHLQAEPLRRRISAIFGRKFDERLVPIQETTEVVSVSGFILKPEYAKKKRGEQFFFVNGRYVKSPFLHNAIREAFEEVLSGDHHPGYFLYLNVDPASLDVNIHPTKTEVKFEDERSIYAVLRSAGRHAIGQFNVGPAIDFNAEASFQVPPLPNGHFPKVPQIRVNPNFNPFESHSEDRPRLRTPDQQYERMQSERNLNTNQELASIELQEDLSSFWDDRNEVAESRTPSFNGLKMLPWGKYAVTILGDKLLLIDLAAARFRILFDQIWLKLQHTTLASQQILFPIEMNLDISEFELLQLHAAHFAVVGFDWSNTENSTSIQLTGIPMILSMEQAIPAMEKLLENMSELEDLAETELIKNLATSLSKQAAGSKVPNSPEELNAIREQLLSSSNPQYSPSGKKIITELSQEDLVKLL
jgi:DNA mismatch repair protein MutL